MNNVAYYFYLGDNNLLNSKYTYCILCYTMNNDFYYGDHNIIHQ